MTRAAEKVFLSPGAVSLQLHNLADELHTELFVRSGKRLIPTPAANRLAEHAKDLIKRMGQIKQEFENDLDAGYPALPLRHWRHDPDLSTGETPQAVA